MKRHISFIKYKKLLESNGYTIDKGTNIYYDLKFITYFFTNIDKTIKERYMVNVFLDKDNNTTDYVMSINIGNGSPYLGWKSVNIDMRKKYWKDLSNFN